MRGGMGAQIWRRQSITMGQRTPNVKGIGHVFQLTGQTPRFMNQLRFCQEGFGWHTARKSSGADFDHLA